MDDDKVHELLDRYRPVGPVAGLRRRALSTVRQPQHTWSWAAVAAALLAMSLGLRIATTRALAGGDYHAAGDVMSVLVEVAGGEEEALQAAQLMAAAREFRALLKGYPDQTDSDLRKAVEP